MSLGYSRFAPSTPYDQFNGPEGGAAIQAMIDATPAGGTLYLPRRIYTLQTLVFSQPITVVIPEEGTRIYGSLYVRARPLSTVDPGYGQISSAVRSSVQVIDLAQNFIYDWGEILPFTGTNSLSDPWWGGFNVTTPAPPALMCDDRQMELVRWPLQPTSPAVDEPWYFSKITSVTSNSVFTDTTIPSGWSVANWSGKNLSAVSMYPGNDNEYMDYYTSATVSSDTITLTNAVPSGPYGTLDPDVRYVIHNVLEELLYAGQYYIDVNNLRMYFIPPSGATSSSVYRISWATEPMGALYGDELGGCSGISFVGGPLAFYGCRGNAFQIVAGSPAVGGVSNVTIDSLQAFGIGTDAFLFQSSVPNAPNLANWSIGQLVVDWCGGAGLWYGPSGGTGDNSDPYPYPGFPTLDQWNSSLGSLYFARTSQWCRSTRGACHINCVGCEVELIVSYQNPNHHFLHDSHDFVVNSGYFDGSFTEGGDVGIVYSSNDPTTFGTVLNNFTIVNIPTMTDSYRGLGPYRRGIYVDNTCSGVTVNDATFINCNSEDAMANPDYCVYINGGQACTINGVNTIDCIAHPVGVISIPMVTDSWTPFTGQAWQFFISANTLDGRYVGRYGTNWEQMPLGIPYTGAPINNSVLRIFPGVGSAGQEDLTISKFNLNCPINQPQGAVSSLTEPPLPPAPL